MYITSSMVQKAEVPDPWFADLLTYPLMPAKKQKKSKAGRKISEILAFRGWANYCPKWKSARPKKLRKDKGSRYRQENCQMDNFKELLEEFVVLNKTHPVNYQSLKPKLKKADPNPKIQSRTAAFCLFQYCMSCPVPKLASNWKLYESLKRDPVNEKYWNDVIQRHLWQQKGKPSPFACLSPNDSLKLLRCGDVHPNPGPPKTKSSLELTINEKQWIIIGGAIVLVLIPSLRLFLDAGLNKVYTTLQSSHGIDAQTSGQMLPCTKRFASNYKFINGNDRHVCRRYYDFKVNSHIDLAKLYLKDSHTANFTAINDECDPSAVLNLLELLPHVPGSGFTPAVQNKAKNVRELVRNPWAHCNLAEWKASKFQTCFQHMDSLLRECGLTGAADDLKEWEQKGVKGMDLNLVGVIDDLRTKLKKWKTVEKQDLDRVLKSLDEMSDTLKRLEQGVADLSKDQHEMRQSLDELQEDMKEGQKDLKMGQEYMKKGHKRLKMGQEDMKKGQRDLKMGQQDMKEGQKDLKMGQEDIRKEVQDVKEGQQSLEKGQQHVKEALCKLREDVAGLKQNELRVQQLTEQFKSTVLSGTKYMDNLFLSPEIADIKIDTLYTKPVVIRGRKTYDFHDMGRSEVLQAYTHHKSAPIKKTEDLFKSCDESGKHPRTILLTGRAGIGKTLFVQKMARDWAQGDLLDDGRYQFVFFFSFRQLNLIDQHLTLQQFLNCAAFSPELEKDMFNHICEDPKSVLFIMDGYDEFNCCIKQKDIIRQEDKISVSAICAKLATGKLLSGATVLITSRPQQGEQLKEISHFDICGEILGFTSNKVEEYITHFFEDNSQLKETVLSHIRSHENLLGFCYVPVNCFITMSSKITPPFCVTMTNKIKFSKNPIYIVYLHVF